MFRKWITCRITWLQVFGNVTVSDYLYTEVLACNRHFFCLYHRISECNREVQIHPDYRPNTDRIHCLQWTLITDYTDYSVIMIHDYRLHDFPDTVMIQKDTHSITRDYTSYTDEKILTGNRPNSYRKTTPSLGRHLDDDSRHRSRFRYAEELGDWVIEGGRGSSYEARPSHCV